MAEPASPISHVSIGANRFEEAAAFYDAVMLDGRRIEATFRDFERAAKLGPG